MGAPALERANAVFETADGVVAVEKGSVREALGRIDLFGDAVVDDRGVVLIQTNGRDRQPVNSRFGRQRKQGNPCIT